MLVIALLMCGAAGLAAAMKPTRRVADAVRAPQLDRVIPTRFGDWQVDPNVLPVTVSPDVQAKLDQIYNQSFARTYVNSADQRIMLVIAYGGDQSDAMRAHLPESCYTAQGFIVNQIAKQALKIGDLEVPVMRLFARQGPRREPITYWIRVGDKAVRGFLEQRIVQLGYGLRGEVTDGVLVRVSSISPDLAGSYTLHDDFVRDLLRSLNPRDREFLVGAAGRSWS